MDQDFINYFNEELIYIKQQGKQFANAHPNIAGNLRISDNDINDPHVSRIIESFAFLTARIRNKLDDEYSETHNALLDIIYPHYQSPIPSMSIIQFQAHQQASSYHQLPKHTLINCDNEQDIKCIFQTAYSVNVTPLNIAELEFVASQHAPSHSSCFSAKSILKLTLSNENQEITLDKLIPPKLSIFINSQRLYSYKLFELLNQHVKHVIISSSEDKSQFEIYGPDIITPQGFADDEALLPYPSHITKSHRHLTEHFALPEKFLFFNLKLAQSQLIKKLRKKVDIYFILDDKSNNLSKNINNQFFVLNCSPIVNIFEQKAEPIRETQHQSEYKVIANKHLANQYQEIYSIQQVSSIDDNHHQQQYLPYFSHKHHHDCQYYWHSSRKPRSEAGDYHSQGSDVYLSLSDLTMSRQSFDHTKVINVDLLVTNGDFPAQLPYGGEYPKLHFWSESYNFVDAIKTLRQFTPSYRFVNSDNSRWQLISQLSLNHFSLTDEHYALDTFKEMLTLYDPKQTAENKSYINSIIDIKTTPKTMRHPTDIRKGFCQGHHINFTIDESKLSGLSLWPFLNIIHKYLTNYCSINSFITMTANSQQQGEIGKWKAIFGNKTSC